MDFILEPNFWFATLRSTTPVLFATLAALIASRSGALNLSLEGTMLVAALSGVVGSAFSQSLLVGMLSGWAMGLIYTMILAYFALNLKANMVLTGIALNLAASGGTVFALSVICGDKTMSASLKSLAFPALHIPLIKDIPILGEVLSGHNVLTYVALLAVVMLYILLNKTQLGIQIRAVGENASAAESVGISVKKVKYIALLFSGTFASFGGMFLSMGYVSMFTAGMTAGRGYIALATSAMSNANPLLSLLSSMIYGVGDTLANYMQSSAQNLKLIQMIPYLFILVFYILYSLQDKMKNKKEDEI